MRPVGLFGGTFDPIHFGHLRAAFELTELLDLERVLFIPAADPPHRGRPLADAQSRLAMVLAAVEDEESFAVDDRELRRPGPSYTVLTLEELRRERGDTPLVLMLGMDAFLGLPTWHRWDEILDFAHMVVAHRPGWQAPGDGELGELLARRRTGSARDLHEQPHGRVHVHAVTQLEIASTEIRRLVADGYDPRYLMPDAVREAIRESSCYTKDSH